MAYQNNRQNNGGSRVSHLKPIFEQSFPGQNLFSVSLVRDDDPELKNWKNRYFCFLKMAPSSQNQDGSKTFDRTRAINIKVECVKIKALAKSIRLYCEGKGQIANYRIFADPGKSGYNQQNGVSGSTKSCFAGIYTPTAKQGSTTPPTPMLSISMQAGDKPFGISCSISEGLAIADILDFIGDYGIEQEAKNRAIQIGNVESAPNINNSNGYDNSGPFPNDVPPPPAGITAPTMPTDDDNPFPTAEGFPSATW